MSYLKFSKPNEQRFRSFSSESAKYAHLTAPYCGGCGVDIASQGAAVVPWAISFDLPEKEFLEYSNGAAPKGPVHLRGFADRLPFETASLDFVYSSHLLEDYLDPLPVLTEWNRCVRIGGNIVILVPDKVLWNEAIAKGQSPNNSHKHEYAVGELSEIYRRYYGHFEILRDELTAVVPDDYSILFTARRVR